MFLLIIIMKMRLQKSFLISIHLMFLLITVRSHLEISLIAISIHLMFLLIVNRQWALILELFHFNTSHVSINRKFDERVTFDHFDFNTSHVSINHKRS